MEVSPADLLFPVQTPQDLVREQLAEIELQATQVALSKGTSTAEVGWGQFLVVDHPEIMAHDGMLARRLANEGRALTRGLDPVLQTIAGAVIRTCLEDDEITSIGRHDG